jgi:outer membrane protein insertion porin family
LAARGKSRLSYLRCCFKVCLVTLLFSVAGPLTLPTAAQADPSAGAPPQQPPQSQAFIQRIEFANNRRIRSDVLRARIFTRENDAFNPAALDRDLRSLWNTNYFDDVRLSVEDSPDKPNGKIVIFFVVERPTIRRIVYKGNKSISESDILDRYKEAKVGLTQDSPFDPTKIKKAEVVLRDLLAEHGRQFATITATYEKIQATNSVVLTFNIVEGAKVKVGKITIVGNHAFSSRRIIRSMRHSRPYGFDAKIMTVNVMAKTFDKAKLDEDMEIGIRGLYQDNGYFEALIRDPVLKTVDVKNYLKVVGSKNGKATDITIQIEEGDRYKMGKLYIINSDPEKGLQLKHDFLISLFPLKEGDIMSADKIRKAVENYTKLYGRFGFMDFTAEPNFDIDHKNKAINITLKFTEQKPYYIHRINIAGNLTTRDKVIRRELLLDEGDLYNNYLWEVSVLRLNQLGFFDQLKPETAAQVTRNIKLGTVDLNLKVKEKNKQSISFTGGVSGIAGSFLGLSYQTSNFLGLGETLTLSVEYGTVQKSFLFGFTEPYLFDRPIATGFTVFSSRYNFDQARQEAILLGQKVSIDPSIVQNYNQNSKGFTLFASYPVKRWSFTRIGVSYGYTDTSIVPFSNAATLLFTSIQFQSVAGPSALKGIHQSRITTTANYNTIDNPQNPHSGKSFFYSFGFEGTALGGNTKAIANVFSATYFRPNWHKRNTIGLRFIASFNTSYGGSELPPFERVYAGGEDTLRGFDIQTVSPIAFIPIASSTTLLYSDPRKLDPFGNPTFASVNIPLLAYTIAFPGGDSEAILNAEYRIPIAGPVSFSFFLDAGIVGVLRRNQLNLDATGLANLQRQFPTTQIGSSLLLAQRSNFRPRSSAGLELVVQLPIVQAPFRLYWAYNYMRYNQLIVAPVGDFFLSDELKRSLPPGVLDFQILPQLTHTVATPTQFRFVDPLRTLRFTVSRTF